MDTLFDWLRLLYLVAAALSLLGVMTQHRWYFDQKRKVRMLLASLVMYAGATLVSGIELLIFTDSTPGGGRTYLVVIASLTMLGALCMKNEPDEVHS